MKLLRALIFLFLVAVCAASAWAQLGLYGSPAPLEMSQIQPVRPPYAGPAYAGQACAGQAASYTHQAQLAATYGPDLGEPQRTWYPTSAEIPPPRLPAPPQPVMPRTQMTPPGTQWTPQPGLSAPGAMPGPTIEPIPEPAGQPAYSGNANYEGYNGYGVSGYGTGNGCAECGDPGCGPVCKVCTPWYASVSALFMTRDRANSLWTTADANDVAHQIPTFGDYDWRWGGEVTLGRRFCCGCAPWSLEATYWGLDNFEQVRDPGSTALYYNTPLNMTAVGGLQIPNHPGSTSAGTWFDGAIRHVVWREDEFHNIELNALRNQLLGWQYGPWNMDWSFGIRYFRFRDHLIFGAEHGPWDETHDPADPSPYMGDWIYLDDQVTNNLIGLQMGFNVQYFVTPQWKLFVTPKFGIYDNYMELDYGIYVGSDYATQTAYALQYPVHASRNGISFLTQVDMGLAWQISPRWEAKIGYRVIAATGIALAESQVPFYGVDTVEVANIDRNGNLVLHGAFTGLTFTF